jgi:hypothetical protein
MNEREATEIADALLSRKERKKHAPSHAELMPERKGDSPRPERWVIRYLKPDTRDSSIDDGDQLLVIEVDPTTRKATRHQGF